MDCAVWLNAMKKAQLLGQNQSWVLKFRKREVQRNQVQSLLENIELNFDSQQQMFELVNS